MAAKGCWTNQPSPLFIEGYSHFLNYPYLHRAYPLRRGPNGPTPRFSIRRPRPSHGVASPWCTLRDHVVCRHRFPPEPPAPSFEAQTQQNPPSVALGDFETQITKPIVSTTPRARPSRSDACPASPRPCRQHGPLHHVLAQVCPRCQPPRLVTWLLWSDSQDPALALPRSWCISKSPHDLHLSHQPPFLCFSPAHHKSTDMVAQA
jgi:hypothetical protein